MTAEAVAFRPLALAGTRVVPRWLAVAVPLFAAGIAFIWTLHAELQRMYGMTSPAWDFAYDQQVIYNISIGQGFYSSFARANFLGIHFELIFVFLAAVEKLWPNPTVLLLFSSAGLAATAPAGYLLFRSLLPEGRAESPWLAMALAAPIPFWAAIQEAARDFFHPENMALALAMLAAWAGIRGHRVAMWALCVLVLMCKEDQIYTIGVIALLMRAQGAPAVRKQWRFLIYLGGAWFLVCVVGLQTYFRNGGYSDLAYYEWLFLHPTVAMVLAALLRPEALLTVAGVIASMAALPLLAPRWLALVVPPYVLSVLSGHTTQFILSLHYTMLLLFPLVVAGAIGARKLLSMRRLQTAVAVAALLPALVIGVAAGRFPPMLYTESPWAYDRANTLAELRTATAMIPADACVSADSGLTIWLANRHTINDFPDMLSRDCYVVIDRGPFINGPTQPAIRDDNLRALPASGRRVLYNDGKYEVWSPVGA